MTLLEVIVVIAVILILAAMLLPMLAAARKKSSKINCTGCLKQVGLAFRIWEDDNRDTFPMGISVANGGAKELAQAGNPAAVFQVMSNELSTPSALVCPADTNTIRAANFGSLANSNISYFIGVDVTNSLKERRIVSGDCNFEIGSQRVKSGLVSFVQNDPIGWSATRHINAGNLCFAYGDVEAVTSRSLQNYFIETGIETNRLAIP